MSVENAVLQQTDKIFRALDLAQFKACQDAVLSPGSDSSLLYSAMSAALSSYNLELSQANSVSQVQAANQKAHAALSQAPASNTIPEPQARPPETPPEAERPDTSAGTSSVDTVANPGNAAVTVRADLPKAAADPAFTPAAARLDQSKE